MQGVLGKLARVVAPVLFDPKRRGQFSFKDPIDPGIADLAGRANIVASQIQQRFSEQAIEALREFAKLHDEATDILGTVQINERTTALAQIQEILDVPVAGMVEAWVKVLQVVASNNEATIASLKKRRKRGKGN